MSRYLITGGAGFIGSHLTHHLLASGHEVVVLDKASGFLEANRNKAILHEGDVLDEDLVYYLCRTVSGVFHLAAIASVARCNTEWLASQRTNANGLVSVLHACARCDIPMVYASSAAVYGSQGHQPVAESVKASPQSFYGADKLSNELHAIASVETYRTRSIGLRLFNVYGRSRAMSGKSAGVIDRFIKQVQNGESVKITGDGTQVRDFVHVRDVVQHFSVAMNVLSPLGPSAHVLNVCTGKGTNVNRVLRLICQKSKRDVHVVYDDLSSGEIGYSVGDPSKAKQFFGIGASIELEAGISQSLSMQLLDRGIT